MHTARLVVGRRKKRNIALTTQQGGERLCKAVPALQVGFSMWPRERTFGVAQCLVLRSLVCLVGFQQILFAGLVSSFS